VVDIVSVKSVESGAVIDSIIGGSTAEYVDAGKRRGSIEESSPDPMSDSLKVGVGVDVPAAAILHL
jgi:hypothetical protein